MTNNDGQINPKQIQIQGLLDRFLQANVSNNGFENVSNHLDEDTLTAFVEGNLSETEAKPITTHLIDCSFCRHITTELIKLDVVFAEDAITDVVTETKPTKVADVLSGILSKIFGSSEEAVFAHHEPDEENSNETKSEEVESDESKPNEEL